jgi:hypothetical protein
MTIVPQKYCELAFDAGRVVLRNNCASSCTHRRSLQQSGRHIEGWLD